MNLKEIFENSTRLDNNDALLISYYVIDYCKNNKITITNLKLLKLLYFINANYLVITNGTPIFEEKFLAWRHGPVLQSVYDRFKFGITSQNESNMKKIKEILSPQKTDIIDDVLYKYAKKSAWDLVEMTHDKDGPWNQIFKNSKNIKDMCFETIPHSLIFDFYRKK